MDGSEFHSVSERPNSQDEQNWPRAVIGAWKNLGQRSMRLCPYDGPESALHLDFTRQGAIPYRHVIG